MRDKEFRRNASHDNTATTTGALRWSHEAGLAGSTGRDSVPSWPSRSKRFRRLTSRGVAFQSSHLGADFRQKGTKGFKKSFANFFFKGL